MTRIQFGLVVPGDALEKSRRHRYMEDVNRLLNAVKGSYNSAGSLTTCSSTTATRLPQPDNCQDAGE
jgi:hypothetical protein